MMNNRVIDIETYMTSYNTVRFSGMLRNFEKFEFGENVFIQNNGKMYQCKIVGVELPPVDNSDYIYKIELPTEFLEEDMTPDEFKIVGPKRVSRTCDKIFKTIGDARDSAIKELDKKYELNKENINLYFNQYIKDDEQY